MTLKEELEILRGEPIQVFDGDPKDIPCIETSDAEKLCKNPVVSVHMITYNHEPYIRQAIEGVMMQKTDFQFELIIGEDCSQDKTREICFEYQKKYPDKVRVLWWHENVSKLGGNLNRVMAHCRGEFIALCEGDDYWSDPEKLQKQVEVMRCNKTVGLCFCGSKIYYEKNGSEKLWNGENAFHGGLIKSARFQAVHMFGNNPLKAGGSELFLMTATTMIRKSSIMKSMEEFDVFKWLLAMGDTTTWLLATCYADAYFLEDIVSVYRINSGGACSVPSWRVPRDAMIVRLYFALCRHGLKLHELPSRFFNALLFFVLRFRAWESNPRAQRIHFRQLRKTQIGHCILKRISAWPFSVILALGWSNKWTEKWLARYARRIKYFVLSNKLKRLYQGA